MFILPVKRDEGHFIVVGQFKGRTTLITHLEDYKRSAEAAEPYIAVSVHDEFVQSKDIALVRGDYAPDKLRKVLYTHAPLLLRIADNLRCSFTLLSTAPPRHLPAHTRFLSSPSSSIAFF